MREHIAHSSPVRMSFLLAETTAFARLRLSLAREKVSPASGVFNSGKHLKSGREMPRRSHVMQPWVGQVLYWCPTPWRGCGRRSYLLRSAVCRKSTDPWPSEADTVLANDTPTAAIPSSSPPTSTRRRSRRSQRFAPTTVHPARAAVLRAAFATPATSRRVGPSRPPSIIGEARGARCVARSSLATPTYSPRGAVSRGFDSRPWLYRSRSSLTESLIPVRRSVRLDPKMGFHVRREDAGRPS